MNIILGISMRKKCDFNDFERGMDVGASLATPEHKKPRLQFAEDKKIRHYMIGKVLSGLMGSDFRRDIRIIIAEFGVNNMKVLLWINGPDYCW